MPSRYLVEVEYLLPKMAEQITKPEESDVPGVSLRVGHRTWFRSCVSTGWIGEQTFSVPPAPSAGAGGQECLGANLCSDTLQAFLMAGGVGGLVGYCQPHPYPVQAASFLSQSLLGSSSSVQVGGACLLLSSFHSTVMSLEAQATAGGKSGTGGARRCSQNVTTPRRKEAREADTRQLYLAVFLGLKVSASKADR